MFMVLPWVEITTAVWIIRYLFARIYTALGTDPGLPIHVGWMGRSIGRSVWNSSAQACRLGQESSKASLGGKWVKLLWTGVN